MSPSLDKPWFPVETHRGIEITQRGRTFRVSDHRFKSVHMARKHIEHRAAEIADARAVLSLFTPERPMMVGPTVYHLMMAEPALADLMDRVRQYYDGGIYGMPEPRSLPEGVNGFRIDGRPIYDDVWFDQAMQKSSSTTINITVRKCD